jgi:hypothetical protein
MIFVALPSFRPIVFGYDRLTSAILMSCQMEVKGKELVAALRGISKLLDANQPCRLLMDLKNLVEWDALPLEHTLQEWLPAANALGLRVIVLVPPLNKSVAPATEQFVAAAGQKGILVMTFSSVESAHQWLVQH